MKRFSEQLHKKSETIKLRASEKRELRERLVSYMEYHPLPAQMKATKSAKNTKTNTKTKTAPIFTDAFAAFHIPFVQIFKSSAVAAVIVLIVLPFAAEKAVPGDTLYAIKVQFNEEVRSTLTFDSFQKVEWETERLNRRIAEARLLASEGRLTEEVEAEVALAVRTHTENAKREIEELRTQDADEAAIASIALDTTLEVQATSLKGEESDAVTGEITTMNDRPTNLIADAIDESRGQAEEYSASSTLPAYNKLMARVEQNTTRVYELLDTIREVAPDTEVAEVTRRLEDIERSIQDAIELSTEEGNGAQLKLIDVLQRTQKLIVFMTELEVSETVNVESLVPVELTEVEEQAEVVEKTKDLEEKVAEIHRLSDGVEDEEILDKVDQALTLIAEYSVVMASSTSDLTAFRVAANEASALADDVILILNQRYLPRPGEGELVDETSTTTLDGTETKVEAEQASTTKETVGEGEFPVITSGSSTATTTTGYGTGTTSADTVDSI